jgi:hypothetical protein
MELWEHLGFVYFKSECILIFLHFPLYFHYTLFYLIENHVPQKTIV